MKKIVSFIALVGLVYTVNAQSAGAGNTAGDTTGRRHFVNRGWRHANGADSLHKKDFAANGWSRWDNHGSNTRFGRGAQGAYGRHGYGYGRQGRGEQRFPVHYTPEQRKQLLAINEDYRRKSADLYKNDNLTLREYKAGLVTLQKDKKAKLQSLLTPEQKNRIAEFKKKRQEDNQVRAAARLERMRIRLNLTDQQTASIKSQEQHFSTQIQSIRENDNLLAYQKKEQIKALAEKHRDELKSLLSPDQLSQLDNMRQRRFGGK